MALPFIIAVRIGSLIYKVARTPAAQALAREAVKKGANILKKVGPYRPSLTSNVVKRMVKAKDVAKSSRAKGKSPTVKPPKSGGASKTQRSRRGSTSTKKAQGPSTPKSGTTPKSGDKSGVKADKTPKKPLGELPPVSRLKPSSSKSGRKPSTQKGTDLVVYSPKNVAKLPKSGGGKTSSGMKQIGGGSKPKQITGPRQMSSMEKFLIGSGITAAAIIGAGKSEKDKKKKALKDAELAVQGRTRRGSSEAPIKGKRRLQAGRKSGPTTTPEKKGKGPRRPSNIQTKFRTVYGAQNAGEMYFYDKSGKKKLAITKEQLEKTGLTLREFANKYKGKTNPFKRKK
tara:strand:+ start:454 stop:1479 length:1026 start_codon:yes stop_codon:yes gene_type:complete